MKDTFSKDHLPLIDRVVHGNCSPRDNWELARDMLMKDGHTHKSAIELALLRRGAMQGDAWSMCQLARECWKQQESITNDNGGAKSNLVAEAISWWVRACRQNDQGAIWDTGNYNILATINNYRTTDGEYADIEMKCALLTEYYLTDLGKSPWNSQTDSEKIERLHRLNNVCSSILGIPTPQLFFVHDLECRGAIVDGVATWRDKVEIRYPLLDNYERLIQVYFHEVGHIVVFFMWISSEEIAQRLRKIYGISPERATKWQETPPAGELPFSEKDPDTLSYGVYTAWAVLFA